MIKSIMIQHHKISSFLANLSLYPVKFSVKSVLGFDILGTNWPEDKVEILKTPAYFMIGEKDDLVNIK